MSPARRFAVVLAMCGLFCTAGDSLAEGRQFRLLLRAAGSETVLTLDDLAALPQHVIQTHTAYTDGLQRFEGPLLRDVVGQSGHQGRRLRLVAADGDTSEIPWQDMVDFEVLVAIRRNGKSMGLRDLGPVWVVYPRDDHSRLQDQTYDLRWIWQVTRIDVQ